MQPPTPTTPNKERTVVKEWFCDDINSGVGSQLKRGGGARHIKNLDKQKRKVFGMYKFSKIVGGGGNPPVPMPMKGRYFLDDI